MTLCVRELTARGSGAVSVVSVRGPGALERVQALVITPARRLAIGRPDLVRLAIDREDLDEALVCARSNEEVEMHLHGSPPLVRALLAHLGAGVREADVGGSAATSLRTLEERARAGLASAPCLAAARILLDQAEGALRRELECAVRAEPQERRLILRTLAERGRVARFALQRSRIVIAGPVNAGKSTLFNALVGEDRALVSGVPGTTRDLVREFALLGAYPVELIDTAGERGDTARTLPSDPPAAEPARTESIAAADAEDEIEREGQARARAEAARADLVLWLEPVEALHSIQPAGTVRLTTCSDRSLQPPTGAISALHAPRAARERVTRLFCDARGLPDEPWTPDAGVPFDFESCHVITRLAQASSSSARGLEVLLDH